MAVSVFLAGASGAIGRRMVPLLVRDGFRVTGTTRSPEKAAALMQLGIAAVVVDVYDALALARAVAEAEPSVIVHQLTDLPPGLDPGKMTEGRIRNARLRIEGTRNLMAAAQAAGVGRAIVQSIAFAYAPATPPIPETAPLGLSAEAVATMEALATGTPGIQGLVLRYGHLYGPGTGCERQPGGPVHVDAAAHAAVLAIGRGTPGVYNVAEDDGALDVGKARRELGWDPAFRLTGDAPP